MSLKFPTCDNEPEHQAATPYSRGEMINRAAIRRAAVLVVDEAGLADVITGVGADVYDDMEATCFARIKYLVLKHPHKRKTLHGETDEKGNRNDT